MKGLEIHRTTSKLKCEKIKKLTLLIQKLFHHIVIQNVTKPFIKIPLKMKMLNFGRLKNCMTSLEI
jgi:hypothetical protein